ncbi:MAG: DUF695 domain-containing protein [Pseudomonadota bacterium]
MTGNWDFYAISVDDKPASIFVDLGIELRAPLDTLPYLAYVKLFMNTPRSDGLSSSDEFDILVEIEAAIEKQLCGEFVEYVGRNTSGGCREFYFYVASPAGWGDKVAQVIAPFLGYRFETGFRDDPDWSFYQHFLRPNPIERQRIENRRVCEALERHGDKLVSAREIDHWCYFPDVASADAFLADVEALGFQLRRKALLDDGPSRHGLQVFRIDVPSESEIDAVTLPIYEAALRHGGEYDGWECRVEA